MDTQPLPPWEAIHPALTGDRLLAVARLIVDARNAKINVRDHRDLNWNLGCDCHGWVISAFHDAAAGECNDWLTVRSKRGDIDLLFCIGDAAGGVPVKFYRPEVPGQPGRTLRQTLEELRVIQESLDLDDPVADEGVVRLAVGTDDDGRATDVRLVRLTLDGTVAYSWPIWTSDPAVRPIGDVPRPEGVELDEPEVTLHEDRQRELQDDGAKEEGA